MMFTHILLSRESCCKCVLAAYLQTVCKILGECGILRCFAFLVNVLQTRYLISVQI